ncbi:FHA domain-containing protein [Polyangium sorediatum]|uniref:FHA domain-containing protein n=1 Tax=Polyangium sorediatum TaxID=889274 RepID=A0ABT6P7K1_9BACT|nr:FHA domain-containing protein [Polyangium sorediatum]MDI1436518.1 FHA domain-containing protein [Polyangium sorediatum]
MASSDMGVLKHISSGRTVVLAADSIVGRAPRCTVQLADPAASHNHASISWNGSRWEARDLGSTNSTFVDGEALPPRNRVLLARQTVLRFGADAEQWELIDDRGPVVTTRSTRTGDVRAAEDGQLVLPDATNVLLSIVEDSEGHWFVETPDGSRRPAGDEQITVAGETWEVSVPPRSPVAGTYKVRPSLSVNTLALRFRVSRNEEHVCVDIVHGKDVLPLGERAVFDALLLLARERLKDAAEGSLPEEEQGWYDLETLTQDLHVEEKALNVNIYRLREAFGKAGVERSADIVERRRRLLRIGTSRIEILKS